MNKAVIATASVIIIIFIVLPGIAPADRDSAKALNEKGYQLYKQKKYDRALEFFRKAVDADPKRYPQWAGRLPDYRQWTCPVWESIQPRIVQLKTNYFDTDTARREADILARTIRHFS